jgi:hypothetical protein
MKYLTDAAKRFAKGNLEKFGLRRVIGPVAAAKLALLAGLGILDMWVRDGSFYWSLRRRSGGAHQ